MKYEWQGKSKVRLEPGQVEENEGRKSTEMFQHYLTCFPRILEGFLKGCRLSIFGSL